MEVLYIIILLPLLGFVINGLFGKFLPKIVVGSWATVVVFLAFLLSLKLFLGMTNDTSPQIFKVFEWFHIHHLVVDFSFQLDQLSIIMMMIITGIGTLIHLYSVGYMENDEGFYKFFAYLNLFIFSMLLLVLGSNYLVLFVGWEGVGLCSFLLIGFWFRNEEYGKAARKAFIMNRIGDLGMLVGIFVIAYHFETLEFLSVQKSLAEMSVDNFVLLLITISFFIGSIGKSAQIPLFTWLPDAMAGPTPVSALIHAATMVTAGIYLIVRSHFFYDLTPFVLDFILGIGLVTSLITAFIGLRQNDIKKVLAYSTVSQLGFMVMALGVGAYVIAMFHLITHAFFKALMFLGAGSVIHAMGGEQDMRFMGGLKKKIPLTYWTFFIGTLAICGVPPLSGMISKDEILVMLYAKNPMIWVMAMISSGLTTAYMFRLLLLTFFGKFRGTKEQEKKIHESPWTMTLPLIVLSILSIVGGVINLPHFIVSDEFQFLSQWLQSVVKSHHYQISFQAEMFLLILTLMMIGIVVLWVRKKYVLDGKISIPEKSYQGWEKLSVQKLYIDDFYQKKIVKKIEYTAKIVEKFDREILDELVNSIGFGAKIKGEFLRKIQNGSVETYLLLMSFGMGIILLVIFLYK